MGKVYGRTHYWVWKNNELCRIVVNPGMHKVNNVLFFEFHFKDDHTKQTYFIEPFAVAKTQREAIVQLHDMISYEIKREL